MNAIPDRIAGQLHGYVNGFREVLPLLIMALIIVALTFGVSRGGSLVIGRVLGRRRLRRSLIDVLQSISVGRATRWWQR
ncbi:MAG: hypothetical protein R3F54_03205 [Alphaproteobacteria bacterium]